MVAIVIAFTLVSACPCSVSSSDGHVASSLGQETK